MSFVNRKMVLVHIFVIIGVSLAGFCGHGSWGQEMHDFSPFRNHRATDGLSSFRPRGQTDYFSAKSTTIRAVTDDDIPQDHLTNILKDHEIIPDIIDSAPHVVTLEVTYGSGAIVNKGDEVAEEDAAEAPTEIDWDADDSSYYTLVFVDADAPSRLEATQRSWDHWIVGNILGKNISSGTVLTDCTFRFIC